MKTSAGGQENRRVTARKRDECMPAGDTDDCERPQEQGVQAAAGANPPPGLASEMANEEAAYQGRQPFVFKPH